MSSKFCTICLKDLENSDEFEDCDNCGQFVCDDCEEDYSGYVFCSPQCAWEYSSE